MWEVEYQQKDGRLIVVLVGAQTKEEAVTLASQSDADYEKLVYAKNQVGVVWFIDSSDRKGSKND